MLKIIQLLQLLNKSYKRLKWEWIYNEYLLETMITIVYDIIS